MIELVQPLWKSAAISLREAESLAAACEVPVHIARWLMVRGITEPKEVRKWLHAAYPFSSPWDFLEMKHAADAIQEAVLEGKHIVVVGDYDVDGVTSTVILYETLLSLGANVSFRIPHRERDGYGLSPSLVTEANNLGAHLLITVDNGIRAKDALLLAKDLGLSVIITDHHEPDDELPTDVLALVHWARHKEPEEAKLLSGAGVAWKLSLALRETLRATGEQDIADRKWHQGLACIGALADVMPLVGENRRLVREGLSYLERCPRPGFVALCQSARVNPSQVDSTAVAWRLAPRLNAAGRMDSADVAVQLLLSVQVKEAEELAEKLEGINLARRVETERAILEAESQVTGASLPSAVVVAGPWKLGVVGIVAAKLAERFQCPAIVLADTGEDILRGSGRAPAGFSLHGALEVCSETLHHFGGHDAAVGCGVQRDRIEEFRNAFEQVSRESQSPGQEDVMVADDYLNLLDANLDTIEWLSQFSPYGEGNEPPVFYLGPVLLLEVMSMGGGRHARLRIQEDKLVRDIVWFNVPRDVLTWPRGSYISATVTLEENTWQGRRDAQIRADHAWLLGQPLVRTQFGEIYRRLKSRGALTLNDISYLLDNASEKDVFVIMETFRELEFAERDGDAYYLSESPRPKDLREALTYQSYLRERHVSSV